MPVYEGMTVYPGNPRVSVNPHSSRAFGGRSNLSTLSMGSHTGTHVDAPRHFLDDGSGVDALSLDALIGPCEVVDLADRDGHVEAADVGSAERRVLFRTRNSLNEPGSWSDDYAALTEGAAQALIDSGVVLVGIDALSIEMPGSDTFPVHHALLEAGVVIVEGLALHHVGAGTYTLLCLPLKLVDGDGAPARAVLLPQD